MVVPGTLRLFPGLALQVVFFPEVDFRPVGPPLCTRLLCAHVINIFADS